MKMIKLFGAAALACMLAVSASAQDRVQKKRDRYTWYELSDQQDTKLRAALTAVPKAKRKPVLVLCGSPDCMELAKDVDTALEAAGWETKLSAPLGVEDGLLCNFATLCEAILKSTGIKSHLQKSDALDEPAVLNFGRKGR